MAQKLESAEDAINYLKTVKAVSLGQMSVPHPEEYTAIYSKYYQIIDALILLFDNSKSVGDKSGAYRDYLKQFEASTAEKVGLNVGGKALAVFGSLGMILTVGLVADWRDIGEAWTGPSKMNDDMKRIRASLEKRIDEYDAACAKLFDSFTNMVNAMASGNDEAVGKYSEQVITDLTNLKKVAESFEQIKFELDKVGASTAYEGAFAVVKEFAVQVGLAIVTIGACEILVHGVKAAAASSKLATLAPGTIAAARGVITFAENAPKLRAAGTALKGGYEAYHSAEREAEALGQMDESRQFAMENAP